MELPTIPTDRRYWLVRTDSGRYYSEFFHGMFIAVGWDAMSADVLEWDEEELRGLFTEHYPDSKQPMYAIHQVQRFVRDLHIDDIVLIPSESSTYVTFGRITSDMYEVKIPEDDVLEGRCPWSKRRKVEWLQTVERFDLDPYLYRLLNSHHPVTQADEYGTFIDRTMHRFFRKGEEYHFIVHVRHQGGINARILPEYLSALLSLVDVFNEATESSLSADNIQLKINVQSPGPIELIGSFVILVIGVLAVTFAGGTIVIDRSGLRIKTDSFLDKLSDFLDAAHQRRLDSRRIEDLETKIKELSMRLEARYPEELTASNPTDGVRPARSDE